jgi:adenylyltransferase/sulfurtransferase
MSCREPFPADGLDPTEIARYGRHLVLPDVGVEGQLRLRASRVLVVGAGGLGSPLALYLAAAGVGTLGLVDFDVVDLGNLQRQVLYDSDDVGRSKLDVARERLARLNPHVRVVAHACRLDAGNALEILHDYDVVVDGSDNFPTRYLVNDACVLSGKPDVYGSVYRFEGQVAVFWAGHGPCYRCLYPQPPPPGAVPGCAEGGVLGVLPGVVGTLQATEAIKLLLGRGESLCGRLLLFDALAMRFRELQLRRDAACPICGDRPSIRRLQQAAEACPSPPRADAAFDIRVAELAGRLRPDGEGPPALLDVRTPEEWAICRLPGARLIPLGELERRLGELDRARETVVYCHLGGRSAAAVELLRRQGFALVRNLAGGIDAWAREVDPAMPRY